MPDPATCPHANILAEWRPGAQRFAVCRDCGSTLTYARRLRLVPPPQTPPEETPHA